MSELEVERENIKKDLKNLNKLRMIKKGEYFNPKEFIDIKYVSDELSKAFDSICNIDLYLRCLFDVEEIDIEDIMYCIHECEEISEKGGAYFFDKMIKNINPNPEKMMSCLKYQISLSIDYLKHIKCDEEL